MSLPRRVVPGTCYLVTRRCVQRRFLLRPSKQVNAIVRYAFAVAASRHRIRPVALVVEANHLHLIAHDPKGVLPAFMQAFDQLVARALNAHYGRGEAFWRPGSYNSVELPGPEEILAKLVYTITNPVKDGLVRRPEDWPGLRTSPEDVGSLILRAERPQSAFFGGARPEDWRPTYRPGRRLVRPAGRARPRPQRGRRRRRRKGSRLPLLASVAFVTPPGFEDLTDAEFRALLRRRVDAELERIYAEREAQGKRDFMGAKRVREQDPFESAGDTFPTFALTPHLSSQTTTEARARLLAELIGWRAAYRLCREAWQRGRRGVVFPHGTYGMRVLHRARVALPP